MVRGRSAAPKVTVTITQRGVITLPASLRRALRLEAEDRLIAEITPEGLLLRPAVTLPIEIYSDERIGEFDEAEAELARSLRRDRSSSARVAQSGDPRRRTGRRDSR